MRLRNGQLVAVDRPDPPIEIKTRTLVPLWLVDMRLRQAGKWEDVQAALASDKALEARFNALREGIYADDADARALLRAAGANADVILAP